MGLQFVSNQTLEFAMTVAAENIKPLRKKSAGAVVTSTALVRTSKNVGAQSSKLVSNRRTLMSTSAAVTYLKSKGVDDFVVQVNLASPMQLVDVERRGVDARFLKDLSKRMNLPTSRVFSMFGVPKATAEKKAANGEVVSGSGGHAAIAMAKLLGTAKEIVENSTAKEAIGFDSATWLGKWLELPQPSLGGRKPADMIDTPTGVEVVTKLLGAIQSGAYQ
jgi:putative toxin-antitoxin system antitoxin component (TIGR02293 family)